MTRYQPEQGAEPESTAADSIGPVEIAETSHNCLEASNMRRR
jgi:hypothetical protein